NHRTKQDRQHERNRLSIHLDLEWDHVHSEIRIHIGVLALELSRDTRHLHLCLLPCDVRAQPAEGGTKPPMPVRMIFQPLRMKTAGYPELHLTRGEPEIIGHDADDREIQPAEVDDAADCLRR